MSNVYKFKVFLDDEDEDFLREVELDANSTFEDLHFAILDAVGLNKDELASFYICDSLWNKEKEITLLDMSEDENKIDIMSECKLKNFINDNHQKIIYEYDFLNMWVFMIELIGTRQSKPKEKFPLFGKKIGKLKQKAKVKNSFMPSEFDEENDFEFPGKEFESFEEDELAEGFGIDSGEFGDDFDEK